MGTRRDTASMAHAASIEEALAFCQILPLQIDGVAVRASECTTESGKVRGTFEVTDGTCPNEVMLPVPLRAQQTVDWCWAASAEMTMAFLGKQVDQCQQASDKVGDDCCTSVAKCPDPGSQPPCVQAGWPNFDAYGFDADVTEHRALEWDELTEEITEGRPVPFSWAVAGYGHMMVVRGVRADPNGTRWVHINDPEEACEGHPALIMYEDYVGGSDHTHWRDYLHIHRRPSTSNNVAALRSRRTKLLHLTQTRPAAAPSQGTGTWKPTAKDAARATVEVLGPSVWSELGLAPTVQPDQIVYDTPLPDALIWQRDLAKYKPGDDPMKVIKDTGLYFVPMGMDGALTSGLMVRKQGNSFSTIRVGNIPLAKKLAGRLHSSPPGTTQLGLARVPFLHANLLVARGGPAAYLMFLEKDARVVIPPYTWLKATDAMAELARLARTIVGGDIWR